MVTVDRGTEIYELEGHSALRITTPNTDVAISYGMFNFNKPGFVYRFVKGETDYSVGEIPWSVFVREYQHAGRGIRQQTLNLTADEKARLLELIKINLRPENREYRYNYLRDNCATRPLRIVELAIGDTIILGASTPQYNSFRDYMRHFHVNYPWYQFGIDLALGNGIDKEMTNREKSFAPVVLRHQLNGATVGTTDGRQLVSNDEIVLDIPADFAVLSPTPWYATPLFWSWTIAIVSLIYFTVKIKLRPRDWRYPRAAATVMFVINGLIGCLLTFLIFASVHDATNPNFNYLWLNPLCFVPAVTLWINRARTVTIIYMTVNIVALFLLIILWSIGIQSPNPAFIPLVLIDLMFTSAYILNIKRDIN